MLIRGHDATLTRGVIMDFEYWKEMNSQSKPHDVKTVSSQGND
jgi:hypothetical protein